MGLKMNPKKTKAMPVHKKQRQQVANLDRIIVGGEQVEWTEEFRYLGFILNSEGSYSSQVENVMNKMPQNAMTPTSRLNKYSNVDPRIIVNVARAYMMSTLLYSAQITPWFTMKIKAKLNKMEKYER